MPPIFITFKKAQFPFGYNCTHICRMSSAPTDWKGAKPIGQMGISTGLGLTCTGASLVVGDLGSFPGSGRSLGEGNGSPRQCSCLENPMDRGAWRATVLGVAKTQT